MGRPPKASDYAHLPQTGGAGVYVVINDAMPGMVKVGFSTDLTKRLKSLSQTNVPLPFVAAALFQTPPSFAAAAERIAHVSLVERLVSEGKEFFFCESDEALRSIIAVVETAVLQSLAEGGALNNTEAAAFLGVSTSMLARTKKRGDLPNRNYFSREELLTFLRELPDGGAMGQASKLKNKAA